MPEQRVFEALLIVGQRAGRAIVYGFEHTDLVAISDDGSSISGTPTAKSVSRSSS